MDDAMLERIESGEKEFSELVTQAQLQNGQAASVLHSTTVDMGLVRQYLKDSGTTLVEYFQINDEILAFVMDQNGDTQVVRNLTSGKKVASTHRKLQFQLRKLSLGGQPDPRIEERLLQGTILHLNKLYSQLIEPIEDRLSERVIVVPHGVLHYIPFHALHDGENYLIDRHEVTYAPSASVLQFCLENDAVGVHSPLVVGVEDSVIPQAVSEAEIIASMYPDSTLLTHTQATQEQIKNHDALHMATHSEFRPENPAFSRVKLQDEWMTLYDVYNLDLSNTSLVTLSACQTGVSSVLAGDELMGLTRGFFYAGAPSMVVSLREVNDASTGLLMQKFYEELNSGLGKGEALRQAMLSVREERPHPYYWAPFILTGKPF
jgi:CHAT domain-containing protein